MIISCNSNNANQHLVTLNESQVECPLPRVDVQSSLTVITWMQWVFFNLSILIPPSMGFEGVAFQYQKLEHDFELSSQQEHQPYLEPAAKAFIPVKLLVIHLFLTLIEAPKDFH